jgi:hypothetical protein
MEPEYELIDYHKKMGVGFYMPNLGSFYSAVDAGDVRATTEKIDRDGSPEIVWRIETPIGSIERARIWEQKTYAWGISRWGIRDLEDLRVLQFAMSRRRFVPHWERYRMWDEYVGDDGVVYLSPGYSAIGFLMHQWMGIETLVYATADYPEAVHEAVDAINESNLELVDLICESPAAIIMMGDNFSSDIQPPWFFAEWSRPFYAEAIRRLHRAGKKVAVHIDGKLKGALEMFREIGADCADAVTPTPLGDLDPTQCRAAAGEEFILSGGVSPELWLPDVPRDQFERKVLEWLEQRAVSPRIIAAAGDQVPPGAEEERIAVMRDLVEHHGRF